MYGGGALTDWLWISSPDSVLAHCSDVLEELEEQVKEETGQIVRQALLDKCVWDPRYKLPRMANVSVVLCGDMHIRALNFQHRNKDKPTDVLSFEMNDELDNKVSIISVFVLLKGRS